MYRQSAVTYADLIADLEQALAWLESMGISTATKRHAMYLRTLRKIDREWRARGEMRASDVPVSAKLMTTSAAEAFQLIRVWRAFAGREPDGLKRKLRTFAGGPPLERDERPAKSGNSARDIGFELEVAAFLSQAGPVDFSRGVDVAVPLRGMSFLLECKRPSSLAMVAKNLDRAATQIVGELRKTRLVNYGVPAISVAKAEWPGGVVLGASRISQVHGSLRAWVARIDRDYLAPWFSRRSDSRLAAVLVHIPYEVELSDSPPMPSVQFWMISGCSKDKPAHRDLLALMAYLGLPE